MSGKQGNIVRDKRWRNLEKNLKTATRSFRVTNLRRHKASIKEARTHLKTRKGNVIGSIASVFIILSTNIPIRCIWATAFSFDDNWSKILLDMILVIFFNYTLDIVRHVSVFFVLINNLISQFLLSLFLYLLKKIYLGAAKIFVIFFPSF